tara:strand:+ start:612 stop:1226 length:615 start_codon:yes stop_codon:yes gene_type:complete
VDISRALRILVVEDELIIAEGLKAMLLDLGHQSIIIINSVEEAKLAIGQKRFDLAILDVNLEGNHEGIGLGMLCTSFNKPFFFLSSYSDHETIIAAKGAKPGAYVVKPFIPNEILIAIEMSMMHQDTEEASRVSESVICKLGLSQRESEILQLLMQRLTTGEIAIQLFVSPNTVKFHIKNLYIKLDATSRSELLGKVAIFAAEH